MRELPRMGRIGRTGLILFLSLAASWGAEPGGPQAPYAPGPMLERFLAGPMAVDGILECLRLGATDCVPKASLALLAPAVRRALEEARLVRAEREAESANRRLLGLLRATLEATQEGILVADLDNGTRHSTYAMPARAAAGPSASTARRPTWWRWATRSS